MAQALKLLLAAAPSLLCGCAAYTLSDASVTGPADAPLPRVSDDVTRGTVVVRPYFVVGRAEHVQGEIGERDDDPPADFDWTVPEHMMGGTLDWASTSRSTGAPACSPACASYIRARSAATSGRCGRGSCNSN